MQPVNHSSGKQKRGFVEHGWGLGNRLEMGSGQNAEGLGKGEEQGVSDREDGQWEAGNRSPSLCIPNSNLGFPPDP